MTLCFVPVTPGALRTWATGGTLAGTVAAFTATATMLEAFGFDSSGEEAEYTSLCVASVACLVAGQPRLVAVVDTLCKPRTSDQDFGAVTVTDVGWGRVTAIFADDSAAEFVGPARTLVAGTGLAEAWDDPAVVKMLESDGLLWHGPSEWETLAAG